MPILKIPKVKNFFNGFYLTSEQMSAINLSKKSKWLKIEAFAGAGKTSTLNAIANIAKKNLNGLYLAFNSDIVKESKSVFPSTVTCKTAHALAFEHVIKGNIKNQRRINKKLTPSVIAKEFKITKNVYGLNNLAFCNYAIEILNNYCSSDKTELLEEHTFNDIIEPLKGQDKPMVQLAGMILASKIWTEMNKDDSFFPITHDAYLKMWGLTNPVLDYDYILFDESQDANPLMLSIILKQNAKLIFVGDRYQQIYSWRGAVNAMQSIETDQTCQITESFRFGQKIANLASTVLNNGLNANVKIKGNKSINSKVRSIGVPNVIICRTNAAIINYALKYMSLGLKVYVKGGVSQLVRLLKCSFLLKKGTKVNAPELAAFNNWEEVEEYSRTPMGSQLVTLVKLVKEQNVNNLIKLLQLSSKITEADANVTLTTAHKSKGCEWDKVALANDFKSIGDKNFTDEEINLLYVAITRAKLELDISDCEAVKNLTMKV